VVVDLRNTGDRSGDEVVQVYVRDDVASVAEPVRALKAFRRVTLGPGEMRTMSFKLGPDSFTLYDKQMRRVVEPGTFTVYVGTDSNALLSARFEFTGDTLVLAPSTPRFR
jgi:beta-glucosidase